MSITSILYTKTIMKSKIADRILAKSSPETEKRVRESVNNYVEKIKREREFEKEILLKYRKALGEALERERENKGLKRFDIENYSSLTTTQILAIEKGRLSYGIDTLLKYLLAAGLPVPFVQEPLDDPKKERINKLLEGSK